MPIIRDGQGLMEPSGPATERRPRTAAADGSPKQRGRAAASAASRQSQEVASTAADQRQRVVGTASRQAQEVKASVKDQALQLTEELSNQGRGLVQETRQQLQSQAQTQTQNLAQTLFQWAQETQALVDGRPEEAPTVGQYAQQLTDKLNDVASEIEERGVEGLIEEVGTFARRRPGAFLLGAAVVGFGGGRLLRSARSESTDDVDADNDGQPELVAASAGGSGGSGGVVSRRPRPRRATMPAGRNPASQGGE